MPVAIAFMGWAKGFPTARRSFRSATVGFKRGEQTGQGVAIFAANG